MAIFMCGMIQCSFFNLETFTSHPSHHNLCVNFCSRNLEAPEFPVYSVKAHKEIVNSIDGVGGLGIGDGAPEIVTGSRDGMCSITSYTFSTSGHV